MRRIYGMPLWSHIRPSAWAKRC